MFIKLLKRFEHWFNCKCGWFFINGRKTTEWNRELYEKCNGNRKHKENN